MRLHTRTGSLRLCRSSTGRTVLRQCESTVSRNHSVTCCNLKPPISAVCCLFAAFDVPVCANSCCDCLICSGARSHLGFDGHQNIWSRNVVNEPRGVCRWLTVRLYGRQSVGRPAFKCHLLYGSLLALVVCPSRGLTRFLTRRCSPPLLWWCVRRTPSSLNFIWWHFCLSFVCTDSVS